MLIIQMQTKRANISLALIFLFYWSSSSDAAFFSSWYVLKFGSSGEKDGITCSNVETSSLVSDVLTNNGKVSAATPK